MTSAQFLLELLNKTLLDFLEGLEESERHENNNRLSSSLHFNLLRGGNVKLSQLEGNLVGSAGRKIEELLGYENFELIGLSLLGLYFVCVCVCV